jgi:hypothetical protein
MQQNAQSIYQSTLQQNRKQNARIAEHILAHASQSTPPQHFFRIEAISWT